MVFQFLPGVPFVGDASRAMFGVPLARGGPPSSPMEFLVPSDRHNQTFLRVIALFNREGGAPPTPRSQVVPFGCRPPIFEIKGGPSKFTEVRPDTGEVNIATGDGVVVATASCRSGPDDTYLITISHIVKNAKPWYLRMESTEPVPLNYLAVSSHIEEDTLQPRMQFQGFGPPSIGGKPMPDRLGAAPESWSPFLTFLPLLNQPWEISPQCSTVLMRNFGTTPLQILNKAGDPVGGPDSPIVVKEIVVNDRPGQDFPSGQIPPGGFGTLRLQRLPDFPLTVGFERKHTFNTNDHVAENATLIVRANPTGSTPSPVARQPELVRDLSRAGSHCLCGCHSYRPTDPDGVCSCGHAPLDHYHHTVAYP